MSKENVSNDNKSVVILGASSTIARHIAYAFAQRGYATALAARDDAENDILAADIRTRFQVACHALHFDATDYAAHDGFVEETKKAFGDYPECLVLCFGYMEEQSDAQEYFEIARRTIDVNYTGAVSILERFAKIFEARGHGCMGVLTSVAGDRGRKANYIYGSSKAAMTAYTGGLRNRLHAANVSVTTIKPGVIDTKMTWGMKLPGPLTGNPAKVGEAICAAVLARKNVVYVPRIWQLVMLIIQHIPEFQFKKMSI